MELETKYLDSEKSEIKRAEMLLNEFRPNAGQCGVFEDFISDTKYYLPTPDIRLSTQDKLILLHRQAIPMDSNSEQIANCRVHSGKLHLSSVITSVINHFFNPGG